MKKFIRYLYAYEDGQRIRNVGFAKVKQEENKSQVQVQGKHLNKSSNGKLVLYLFARKEEGILCSRQGEIPCKNESIVFQLEYRETDIGPIEKLTAVDGILLEDETGGRYAVAWDDMPVAVGSGTLAATNSPTEDTTVEDETAVGSGSLDMTNSPEPAQEADCEIKSTELEVEKEEKLAKMGSDPSYQKILRRDIGKLPRGNWKLANNSFLLHGYYNYHHLLLIYKEEGEFLGVPGVYHEQEERAAQAFGFMNFVRIPPEELEVSPEQREESEDFGYWCRQIKGESI